MRIVRTSNHDDETVSEVFVGWGSLTSNEALVRLQKLNRDITDESRYFHKIVDNDYKLYKYDPT